MDGLRVAHGFSGIGADGFDGSNQFEEADAAFITTSGGYTYFQGSDANPSGSSEEQQQQQAQNQPAHGEGSQSNLQKREDIATIALSYDGSTDWAMNKAKEGFPGGDPGSNKCNLYVYDVTKAAGADAKIAGRTAWPMPTAGEWANPKVKINNWRVLGAGESPKPGDVGAYPLPGHRNQATPYTGHSAIVVGRNPDGSIRAIAAHDRVVGPESTMQPGIATFRRYIGD